LAASSSSREAGKLTDAALADSHGGAASARPDAEGDALPLVRPLTLILVRHGETAFNAEGRIQGHRDVPLSDAGREQARRLGRRLAASWRHTPPLLPGPPAAAYSSDLSRAAETATLALAALDAPAPPLVTTPALRERSFGDWQGLTTGEIRTRREAGEADPPGGETEAQVWDRMTGALARIAAEHAAAPSGDGSPAVVLVFGHGGSLRSLLARAVGGGQEAARAFRLENTALSVIEFSPDAHHTGKTAGRAVLLNDTAHLLPEGVLSALTPLA
jgi:broad specificity phosphatase PhoE